MHCGRILRVGGPKQKRLFATVNETKVRTQVRTQASQLAKHQANTQNTGLSYFSDFSSVAFD
jgi:hypothetical protein